MDLMEGESLLWQGRPSWRAMMSYWVSVVLLAIVVLVLGILIGQGTWFGLLAAVILVVGLIKGWLERVATLYTITDRRIIIRKGILSRARARRAHRPRPEREPDAVVLRPHLPGRHARLRHGRHGGLRLQVPGIATRDELRTTIDTEYVRRTREMPSGMS